MIVRSNKYVFSRAHQIPVNNIKKVVLLGNNPQKPELSALNENSLERIGQGKPKSNVTDNFWPGDLTLPFYEVNPWQEQLFYLVTKKPCPPEKEVTEIFTGHI